MRTSKTEAALLLLFCSMSLFLPVSSHAWEPNADDLTAAINAGDFSAYHANISTWLSQKVPAGTGGISEAALKAFLKEPVVADALAQRQFISRAGFDKLGTFARADEANRKFLTWLLKNTPAMDLYLEGATPIAATAREDNRWPLSVEGLDIWKRIYFADPDSHEGLYLKLAIATALRPPGTGNRGAGMQKEPSDPLVRYKYFKEAHKNKELFPGFDNLSVWEYQHIVSSCASEGDLTWAREMINTWRPDLRIKEQVVKSTSEVWYRNSPHPYTDYKAVLSGGGKCGPRSSWSVMICQAFGIPAIGVSQPKHACVAYKMHDPSVQPQPGSAWKVGYGAGWQVSRLEGMSGLDFLAGVEQRSHVAKFSQVEHLRWLASALASGEQASAVLGVARKIQQTVVAVKTDITASARPEEAEREVQPEVKAVKAPAAAPAEPPKVIAGVTRVEAAAFTGMSGVCVYDCFTGGKQVNFQKNIESSWVDYRLDVAVTGTYGLEVRVAAPNFDQVLDINAGTNKLANIKVPNTTGLWETSPPVDIKLEKGKQTLRISAPFQRGVAVRYFELKFKG